mmetsp:Transcript_31670/g.76664  ORF Transcript_31670/g.76664 Transcript_31670/m.76664 type:complete len:233 (-) Transcript_31670:1184-1882(-)
MYRHISLNLPSSSSSSPPSLLTLPTFSIFLSAASICALRIWNDCNTCNPATIAFVVAIAGMIFPAMPLASYRLCSGPMENTYERRFEAAVTNLMATSSSLSNSGRGCCCVPPLSGEVCVWAATSTKHEASSETHSPGDHTSLLSLLSLAVGGIVVVSVHLAISWGEIGTGTLSAVLYRSIPICFWISVMKSAARACCALVRSRVSLSSLLLHCSDGCCWSESDATCTAAACD